MSPGLLLTVFAAYSILLFVVVWLTSRKADNQAYFIGSRSSRWWLVAYGMIGASLSGVTFMSVPGDVFNKNFTYLQVVMGYIVGYTIIALVLLPVYYRLQLTSIYTYLLQRFGPVSHKTGSAFFILSRVIGAAFRMFIVINVLQNFVFDALGIPFVITVAVFMLLILLYTYEGGVKTIVWTDTLQTTFMLVALGFTLWYIWYDHYLGQDLKAEVVSFTDSIGNLGKAQIFNWDYLHKNHFLKDFLGGAAIAVAMTGLDQEMMQKNLSCKNIKEAKKNVLSFTAVLVVVNILFVLLGAALILFAQQKGITIDPKHTDDLFPTVALKYLGVVPGLIFLIGLISAAYPSADGALTALTTVFCFDFLGIQNKPHFTEKKQKKIRYIVHIGFAILLLGVILLFRVINNDAVIRNLFVAATYTYGPLLGLYAFGFLTRTKISDSLAWLPCLLSPALCWILSANSAEWLGGYKFGFELLIVNGSLTFLGLWLLGRLQNRGVHPAPAVDA
ncbi:MAG: sodium:solute symporter [Bacteroidetes bacterium]|nr:sodium:solute symporter [Bacteroidota bacterium]